MKRSIRLIEREGEIELDLGKVVAIDTPKKCIMLEEMPDGKWRLTYNKNLIPDIQKFVGMYIHREDD